MAKKDLSGGIANLLSGADQRVTQKTGEAAPEAATQMEIEPFTAKEEKSLIASIDDEELREELKERLRLKRLIGRGRPRKDGHKDCIGDGYERTSLIIQKDKWAKIKEIALIETLTMKEIVELALDIIIERYEAKHGEVIPMQNRKKDIRDIF